MFYGPIVVLLCGLVCANTQPALLPKAKWFEVWWVWWFKFQYTICVFRHLKRNESENCVPSNVLLLSSCGLVSTCFSLRVIAATPEVSKRDLAAAAYPFLCTNCRVHPYYPCSKHLFMPWSTYSKLKTRDKGFTKLYKDSWLQSFTKSMAVPSKTRHRMSWVLLTSHEEIGSFTLLVSSAVPQSAAS